MGERRQGHETKNDRRILILLTGLGTASAAWAIFLWRQLIASRGGAEPFCVFGASDCSQLWDGAFASSVHRVTGLPVAGWGVVWGLVATLLPLLMLAGWATGMLRAPRAAIRFTGLAGLATFVLLLATSLRAGTFCSNCAVTYALSVVYALVALAGLEKGERSWSERGAFSAALLTVALYALLLYPGSRTPRSSGDAAREAIVSATESLRKTADQTAGSTSQGQGELADFLGGLPDPILEGLSTTLDMYRNATARPIDPPRALFGTPGAPVVITEFVDTLCSHCADLHETLKHLLEAAPTRFAVDSRHFPLDGNCNARLPTRGPETVRCLSARVQICAEALPNRFDLSGELFASQEDLTTEDVLRIASAYIDQMSLDACLTDPATEQKLQDDVAFAGRYNPTGTPLVLVNGRQGSPFGPFLLAMILSAGNADHPAFGTLPAPQLPPVP